MSNLSCKLGLSCQNLMVRTFGQACQLFKWSLQMPDKVAMEDTQLSIATT